MARCIDFSLTNHYFPAYYYAVILFNAGNIRWHLCNCRDWPRIIDGVCRTDFFGTSCILRHWFLHDGCFNNNIGVESVGKLTFALLIPALLAFVMGYTMARLNGYYLAMATLALGIIVHSVLVEWRGVTKGATGFYGIPQINLFGFTINQGISYYYLVWFFVVLVVVISLNIVHSRVGVRFVRFMIVKLLQALWV